LPRCGRPLHDLSALCGPTSLLTTIFFPSTSLFLFSFFPFSFFALCCGQGTVYFLRFQSRQSFLRRLDVIFFGRDLTPGLAKSNWRGDVKSPRQFPVHVFLYALRTLKPRFLTRKIFSVRSHATPVSYLTGWLVKFPLDTKRISLCPCCPFPPNGRKRFRALL